MPGRTPLKTSSLSGSRRLSVCRSASVRSGAARIAARQAASVTDAARKAAAQTYLFEIAGMLPTFQVLDAPRTAAAYPQPPSTRRRFFLNLTLLEDSCNARQAKICALRFPSMRPQLGAAAAAPHDSSRIV